MNSSDEEGLSSFDTYDTQLYFFDEMDRKTAEDMLRVADVGTFLIRQSASKPNSYSLSVRISLEDEKSIRHFIIERRQIDAGRFIYHMNGSDYRDIPTLVTHFSVNPIGSANHSTLLRRLAPKRVLQTVTCIAEFGGERATDLPFNRGEMLEVLEKPEEDWWVARNAMGNVGFVPVNYLRRTNDEDLLDSPDLNECSLESNEINTSSS